MEHAPVPSVPGPCPAVRIRVASVYVAERVVRLPDAFAP